MSDGPPLHPIDQIRADIDRINAMPFTPGRLLYARLPDAVVDHLRDLLTPPIVSSNDPPSTR